jgi:ubiquinone/menaquinone biosynthesis C-methylase UbiE
MAQITSARKYPLVQAPSIGSQYLTMTEVAATSAFNDPEFAAFWDEISGKHGHTYKQYVVDPLMFRLMGSLSRKVILDLGCGNGYLGPRFIKRGVKTAILMDLSPHNLEFAKKKNRSSQVKFLLQDATRPWKLGSHSVDIIFSDMLLNEIKNITRPVKESFRVLRKGGQFILAVTHPSWDLYEFALSTAGKSRNILKGPKSYFFRGNTKFILGNESVGQECPKSFEVEHYQRPLEDYFSVLLEAGFAIAAVKEPKLTAKLLRKFPGYREMTAHPIALVIQCFKK